MADVSSAKVNRCPVIGILSVDIAFPLQDHYGKKFTSYLAASYVKFIEGGGGRVVPIWIGKNHEYYKNLLSQLNGILIPGGAVYFFEKNGFADAGKHIFNIACEMNKNGTYMPILGICLGYELLMYASGGSEEIRQDCDNINTALPLNFQNSSKESRLFGNAPPETIEILSTENVTFNFHKYCITEEDLKTHKIHSHWNILSTNFDKTGKNYISTVEHKRYPFYGLQYHPEKNPYEHKSEFIPKTLNAIKISNYFAQFFINEARKNQNHFDTLENESRYLIYNFVATNISPRNISWEQCYLFENGTDYPE